MSRRLENAGVVAQLKLDCQSSVSSVWLRHEFTISPGDWGIPAVLFGSVLLFSSCNTV